LDQQGNYQNPTLGIGFQVPEGWLVQELKKTQPSAPDIAVVAPYSGGFTPSISLTVEKANGTSLNDFLENKKSQIVRDAQSQNVSFLSEQDRTINGYNAKIVILRENFISLGQNIVIKFKDIFIFANDHFYTLTYANDEKNFDSSISNYNSLLNSITLTNEENFLGTKTSFAIGAIGAAVATGAILVIRKKKKRS